MSFLRKNRVVWSSVTRSLLSIRPRLIRAAEPHVVLQYFLSDLLVGGISVPQSMQLRDLRAFDSKRFRASMACLARPLHFLEQNLLFFCGAPKVRLQCKHFFLIGTSSGGIQWSVLSNPNIDHEECPVGDPLSVVTSPFRRLHLAHAIRTLSQECEPPLLRGFTCSTTACRPGSPRL